MSYHSELDSEQAVEFYDPEEYEMNEDATRKELNDYDSKPVEVSNDTPAGRATNRILDGAKVKGMQPDEIEEIIEDEYAPLLKALDIQLEDAQGILANSYSHIEHLQLEIKQATLEGIRLGLQRALRACPLVVVPPDGEDYAYGVSDGISSCHNAVRKLDPATILAESEKKS